MSTFSRPSARDSRMIQNEDFGLEQLTHNPADRYKFRTAPLRNLALVPAFFHNGAFTSLEGAIRHHLDVRNSVLRYSPKGLPPDLSGPTGPINPVLDRLDPLLAQPIRLTDQEFGQLVQFVRDGLHDPRANAQLFRLLIPQAVPSGRPMPRFE